MCFNHIPHELYSTVLSFFVPLLDSPLCLGMNSDLILTVTTVQSPSVNATTDTVGTTGNALNPRHFASLVDFLARKQGIVDVRRFQ